MPKKLTSALMMAICMSTALSQSRPTMQVRVIIPCDSPAVYEKVEHEGAKICVPQQGIVSESDVLGARLSKRRNDKPVVLLTLTKEAGAIVREYTRAHLNEKVAIFVNGKLVSLPLIVGPDAEVPIAGSLSQGEAEELVKQFNTAATRKK